MTAHINLSEFNNWYETKLWRQIEQANQPESESVRTTIKEWMPKIQLILSVGGTSPSDFTLHDAQHSFRVAELMNEIIPSDVLTSLSVYELALLLFSAYLHDIGMTPTQSSLMLYYDYLLTGQPQSLSGEQIATFQRWLDEQGNDIAPPLSKDPPTPSTLGQARFLITNYCRAKHVELAEEWIELNLGTEKLGSYAQWLGDLKVLCRSHHQGYHQLITELFDPKPVGGAGMTVHLRYLAIVLRVADILDFDPERTPDVIFRHRQIAPSSIVYWHKDHHISRMLEHGRLTISAEPPDARLHRAIELMIDSIESELRLARQIDDERPLEVARFQEVPLYHRWDVLPDIRRDIRPKNNAYEYIYGAFRPDTEKLLQLLSGRELYGDEMIAVRELLQNAFDAIREQIAYERLQKQNPNDAKWEDLLGGIHEIKLDIEIEEDHIWLVCNDDGAGMSKSIISNYLLVSGNSRRPEVKLLERRCSASGFELGRTGKFGIGVLSYFMIADLVQIRTRRSALAEDTDSTGWFFETDGIGSFGELKKDAEWRQGTEIRLRLKSSIVEKLAQKAKADDDNYILSAYRKDARQVLEQKLDLVETPNRHSVSTESSITEMFCSNLEDYLIDTVCFLPCSFQVSLGIQDGRSLRFPKGWRKNIDDFMRGLEPIQIWSLSEFLEEYESNTDETDRNTSKLAFYKELFRKIKDSLTWNIVEGQLPNSLGTFRINIPVFSVSTGISPIYFNIIDAAAKDGILIHRNFDTEDSGSGYRLPCELFMSWNGMRIDIDRTTNQIDKTNINPEEFARNANIEIDWRSNSAGAISVNRESFVPSQQGLDAFAWVKQQVSLAFETMANKDIVSPFAVLNYLITQRKEKLGHDWLFSDSFFSDTIVFGVINSPAIDIALLYDLAARHWMPSYLEGKHIEWNGELVHQVLDMEVTGYRLMNNNIESAWSDFAPNPDRIVQVEFPNRRIFTPLWTNIESASKSRLFGELTCQFPPEWQKLVGLEIDYSTATSGKSSTIWNRNLLTSNITVEDETWAEEAFGIKSRDEREKVRFNRNDHRPYRSTLLSSNAKASAWLALVISSDSKDLWNNLIKHDQEFLFGIWQLLFSGPHNSQPTEAELYFYNNRSNNDRYRYGRGFDGYISILTSKSWKVVKEPSEVRRLLPNLDSDWTLTIK
jgi:hypothetical protein